MGIPVYTCYILVSVFVIIGAYLNMENPLLQKLSAHNKEMVMGFATLVENRDGSTGGHIRRTTTYVEMLAKELKNRGLYKDELTEDYIKNLIMEHQCMMLERLQFLMQL